ncbi:hypothetical protein J4464_03985 [Candidatus Woesearchaeota archaeon]|nr:hypothetical protein [Candidatus Woesearchaeota archaeon]
MNKNAEVNPEGTESPSFEATTLGRVITWGATAALVGSVLYGGCVLVNGKKQIEQRSPYGNPTCIDVRMSRRGTGTGSLLRLYDFNNDQRSVEEVMYVSGRSSDESFVHVRDGWQVHYPVSGDLPSISRLTSPEADQVDSMYATLANRLSQ